MRSLLTRAIFALLMLSAVSAAARSNELVLSWDDGSCSAPCDCTYGELRGQGLAVAFQAPESAEWLVAVQFYQLCDPPDYAQPDFPFRIDVRRSTGEQCQWPCSDVQSIDLEFPPGEPPACNEDYWYEWRLDQPQRLYDHYFVDGWFFVCIEWTWRYQPVFVCDSDAPIDGHSFFWDYYEWIPIEHSDVMFRAVVADSIDTAVESSTWSKVKVQYR